MKTNVDEIRKRRIDAKLSQRALSLQAGLSSCAINRIENKKTIKVHSLRAKEIAKTLNCNVEEIFIL